MAGSFGVGAPDPGEAVDLAEFICQLGALRAWAGQPSYRVLAKRVGPQLRPPREVSPSTLVDVFKSGRRRLDLDLVTGIVRALGAGAEVARWREAYVRVHTAGRTGGSAAALRQLPADLATFTGRDQELEALLTVAQAAGTPGSGGAATVVISAIEGMAGVGKTQLAIHAAHELVRRGRFRDVQLYVNLRGFDPQLPPVDPAGVLDAFLRDLEVPAQQIPDSLEARATLFRDRIAGKDALIILDNAADEQQVLPLVPASPTCLVLVTSRRSLIGLDAAALTQLDVFDSGEAVALLAQIAGAPRVAAEPEEAAAVVEACGYLPLAVALAAARLRSRPSWSLAYLLSRLRKHGVESVGTRGQSVQNVFDLSYEGLDARTRRLFRLLAVHPGQDFTPAAAAALSGLDQAQAELLLEELQDEHLLQQRTEGRFVLHDLLRAYAAGYAAQDPAEERAATIRVLSWYRATADGAAGWLFPSRYAWPPAHDPSAIVPVEFADRAEAMAWCECEHRNLLAAVERAATAVPDTELAWRLATTMFSYLFVRCQWQEGRRIHELGLRTALAAGNVGAEAWARNNLGIFLTALGHPDRAAPQLTRALEVRRVLGDVSGEAATLSNLTRVFVELRQLDTALAYGLQALATAQRAADRKRESSALNTVAICLHELGRPQESLAYLRRKVAMHREDGDPFGLGLALHNIAELHEDQGEHDQLRAVLREALDVARAAGDLHAEAGALFGIARSLHATGEPDAAREHLSAALPLFEELGRPKSPKHAPCSRDSLLWRLLRIRQPVTAEGGAAGGRRPGVCGNVRESGRPLPTVRTRCEGDRGNDPARQTPDAARALPCRPRMSTASADPVRSTVITGRHKHMRKWMGVIAGTATIAGSLFFVGTGTASATAIPGGGGSVALHSMATLKCVDDSNYGLRDFGCQDPNGPYRGFQQFWITPQPDGAWVLQNVVTGKCIDDSNYGLRDFGCQDQNGPYAGFQQFRPTQQPDGAYVLQNVATGKCIDDSSYGLRDFGCQNQNGGYAIFQQFQIG